MSTPEPPPQPQGYEPLRAGTATPLHPVPGFATPPGALRADPPMTDARTTQGPGPTDPRKPNRPSPAPARTTNPDDADTPTPASTTSSDGPSKTGWRRWRRWWTPSGDPAVIAPAVAGGVLLLAAFAGRGVRKRGAQLRQPTKRQADDIAEPLTRIACRHLPLAALGPDIPDFAAASAAIDGYLNDGPLIVPIHATSQETAA